MVGAIASATDFFESEDNDSKVLADAFSLAAGDRIIGNSQGAVITGGGGATSADYFLVATAAAAPGIYRYRLTLTTAGTAGHIGTIRGLTTTTGVPNAGTDVALQTSSASTTPARFNQWYGFGGGESIYYRVAGVTATTADYEATLERSVITPTNIGSFAAGSIRITTMGQTTADTEIAVYDSNFNAMDGYLNDDETTGTNTSQSNLVRDYAPGTYYLAVTGFNLASNLGSPADDDFRTGSVFDNPGAILNSSTTINQDLDFAITDSAQFTFTSANQLKVGAYDVNFYEFTVVPEPATMAALGLGAIALLRRRRKA